MFISKKKKRKGGAPEFGFLLAVNLRLKKMQVIMTGQMYYLHTENITLPEMVGNNVRQLCILLTEWIIISQDSNNY